MNKKLIKAIVTHTLVPIQVTDKNGIVRTVYIRPDKNSKEWVKGAFKEGISPEDIKRFKQAFKNFNEFKKYKQVLKDNEEAIYWKKRFDGNLNELKQYRELGFLKPQEANAVNKEIGLKKLLQGNEAIYNSPVKIFNNKKEFEDFKNYFNNNIKEAIRWRNLYGGDLDTLKQFRDLGYNNPSEINILNKYVGLNRVKELINSGLKPERVLLQLKDEIKDKVLDEVMNRAEKK